MEIYIRDDAKKDARKLPIEIKKRVESLTIKIIEAKTKGDLPHLKKLKGHATA